LLSISVFSELLNTCINIVCDVSFVCMVVVSYRYSVRMLRISYYYSQYGVNTVIVL
jgi:hypothetical protein